MEDFNEMTGRPSFKKRKTKQQAKDEAIYGVFGDDDDDDMDIDTHNKVPYQAFVSSNAQASSNDVDNSTEFPVQRTNPFDFNQPPKKTSGKPYNNRKMQRKPSTHDNKPQQAEGAWEKYTTGFGSRMLAKFGHKPGQGLGKDKSGISEPIQVKPRPQGRPGLCDIDADHDRPLEHEKVSTPPESSFLTPDGQLPSIPEELKLWKKSKRKNRKPAYDIKELDNTLEDQLIVDMRGPQTRILKKLDDGTIEDTKMSSVITSGPLPELQHNLRSLVDLSQGEIIQSDHRIRTQKDLLMVQEREMQALNSNVTEKGIKLKKLEELMEVVKKCEERSKTEDTSFLKSLAKVFIMMQSKYPEEYALYHLAHLAYSWALPLLKDQFAEWKPLTNPASGLHLLTIWKELLSNGYEDVYITLAHDIFLPKVRPAILNWQVRNCESAVTLIEKWSPVLPPAIMENVIVQLIMPRLQEGVQSWNPRKDTTPIHSWLHPWLPVLGPERLSTLWAPIRHKLATVLQDWNPADPSAHAILLPWKNVFDTQSMESLIVRSILPKLAQSLRVFVINPRHQELGPFEWTIAWLDLTKEQHIVTLLDTGFWPKFYHALYIWLTANPNYEEVTAWYLGWKAQFPPHLQANPKITLHFNRALEIMNEALSGKPLPPLSTFYSPPQSPSARSRDPRHIAEEAVRKQIAKEEMQGRIGIRDIVERLAAEHDLSFLPTNKRHEGKQIFRFGEVNILIDNQLIYIQEHTSWMLISLTDLFSRCGKSLTNLNI